MKILIVGHARHGKDTVAEVLVEDYGLTFASSSYFAAKEVVRPALAAAGIHYESLDDCYEDRGNHRAFWYDQISAYNSENKSRLCERILSAHDIYVGMRSDEEYQASKGLFDLILWVDASGRGVAPEPETSMTIKFNPAEMVLVDNSGTIEDLKEAVAQSMA